MVLNHLALPPAVGGLTLDYLKIHVVLTPIQVLEWGAQ